MNPLFSATWSIERTECPDTSGQAAPPPSCRRPPETDVSETKPVRWYNEAHSVKPKRMGLRYPIVATYMAAPLRNWIQAAVEGQPDLTLLRVSLQMAPPEPATAPARSFADSVPHGAEYDAIDSILYLGGPWPGPQVGRETLVATLRALLAEGTQGVVYIRRDGTRLYASGDEDDSTEATDANESINAASVVSGSIGKAAASEWRQQVDDPKAEPNSARPPRRASRSGGRVPAGQVFAVIVGIATIVGAVAAVLALTSH